MTRVISRAFLLASILLLSPAASARMPGCHSASDCKAGRFCVKGKCQWRPETCGKDTDCVGDDICENQKCVKPPTASTEKPPPPPPDPPPPPPPADPPKAVEETPASPSPPKDPCEHIGTPARVKSLRRCVVNKRDGSSKSLRAGTTFEFKRAEDGNALVVDSTGIAGEISCDCVDPVP